jgi:hypothetical protein
MNLIMEKPMHTMSPDFTAFNEAGKALQSLGLNCRLCFRPADEFITRNTWAVAIECPGRPGNEVRGLGDTAGDALMQALVLRDDALGHSRIAA